MMKIHENIEIEVTDPIEKETEKAIMFSSDGEIFWIPKSLISDDSEVQGTGDTGTLIIHEWFARKAGLV